MSPLITNRSFYNPSLPSRVLGFTTTTLGSATIHQVNLNSTTIGELNIVFFNVYNTSGGYGSFGTFPPGWEHDVANGQAELFVGGSTYIATSVYARVFQAADNAFINIPIGNSSPSFSYCVSMGPHTVAHTSGLPTLGQIVYSKSITNPSTTITLPAVTSAVQSEILRHSWKWNDVSADTGYPPAGHTNIDTSSGVANSSAINMMKLDDQTAGVKPAATYTSTNSVPTIGVSVAVRT